MNTLYWHDYETSGTDPARDRPTQFAGIRTDENLNVIGEPLSVFCKPVRDILPHPRACLVTGITPQQAERDGLIEPEFIARIHMELIRPGTCGVGYNSIRFDDEVTRYSLYRNFFDPYAREWQGGNSRWDIIDMLRLTRALRPEGIEWPNKEDGGSSFRLEDLTEANNIAHESAHDALSDVMATLAMARLVREKQPRLYQYVYENRLKHRVAALLDWQNRKPVLHVSSRLPRENGYLALMLPLAPHPVNKNAIIAFNLKSDPRPLLELDIEAIKERLFTPANQLPEDIERIQLKAIHINHCPVVATPKLLDKAAAERLAINLDTCERHWRQLRDLDVRSKLAEVFRPQPQGEQDPEAALYAGFLPAEDKPLLSAIRTAKPEELASDRFIFCDERYQTLLFRYRARFFPESLTSGEQAEWQAFCRKKLTEPGNGSLTLQEFEQEIAAIESEGNLDGRGEKVIQHLKEWVKEVM